MSNTLTTFEVKVKVKNSAKHYSSFLGMHVQDEIIKMFHRDARTGEQAMKGCEKHGRPISVRKADISKMQGNPENLKLDEMFVNPYENAIAMDEMIWKKRNTRIKNRGKDKENT